MKAKISWRIANYTDFQEISKLSSNNDLMSLHVISSDNMYRRQESQNVENCNTVVPVLSKHPRIWRQLLAEDMWLLNADKLLLKILFPPFKMGFC